MAAHGTPANGESNGVGDTTGAGPFGVGAVPGVFQGEVANGGPTILGPQYPQHMVPARPFEFT